MEFSFAGLSGAGVAIALNLLLSNNLLAQALRVAPADSTGWYVGGQASLNNQIYVIDGMGFGRPTATVGGYGGYQFTPRLAVQIGLSYGRGNTPEEVPSGTLNYYPQAEYVTSLFTMPMLVRWSFATRPHRFRLEGLAGMHLAYFNLRERRGRVGTEPRLVSNTRSVNGYLDLGLGSRLRLGSRLDLATDLLLNFNYQRPINTYFPIAPGASVALGLNYRLR
jgi:hypothetical protein